MIPLKDQAALKQRFARDLHARVRLDLFTQKPSPIFIPGRRDCVTCDDVRKLLQELSGLSTRISLTQHDLDDNAATAREMGVDKAPGIVLRGQANRPVRYSGSPAGRQFAGFIETMLLVAHGAPELEQETVKTLRRLKSDVDLKVFVTPGCAYSPLMSFTAARLAMGSAHVKLEIIEIAEFPELIQRFYVRATPLTVINEQYAIPGVIEEGALAEDLLMAAQGKDPDKGGDPKRLTPLAPPQARQQTPRPSPASGLILPR